MNKLLSRTRGQLAPALGKILSRTARNAPPDASNITDIPTLRALAAQRHNVTPDVHEADFIFQWLVSNSAFSTVKEAVDYYFDDGANSAQKLADLLKEISGGRSTDFSLLEFASGYGCVTRHLENALPGVAVTACDIHSEAVDFIGAAIGTETLLSKSVPEEFAAANAGKKFDVIFALSFFSHMPRSTWTRWISALESLLSDGGLLVFTTHGTKTVRQHPRAIEFDDDGFWFEASSEQEDLDTAEYGSTAVTATFVFREIAALNTSSRIIHFAEGAWWNHQDLYVMIRQPALVR